MLAFEQLVAEGHLVGHTGSGTYVSSELPEGRRWKSSRRVLPSRLGPATAAPRLSSYGRRLSEADLQLPGRKRERLPYDFRHDLIADSLPETWRRLLAGRARAGRPTSLTYGPEQGHPPLRETLARYLGRNRGVLCGANQILITDGSQQAFDLIARVLIDPGDAVALEEPHFIRARQCFRAHGADIVGVPVDAEGLEIRKLSLIVGQAAPGCCDPLPPVSDRRRHARNQKERAAGLGGTESRPDRRRRLRQRASRRPSIHPSHSVARHRGPGAVCRHLFQGSVSLVADRLCRTSRAADQTDGQGEAAR